MKRLLIALLLSACAYAQNPTTAVYPSSVAADADLTVACSRVNTTTTGSLTNVATSVAVANATGLLNGCTISIGSEDLLICGISGTTLSFGKSACPNVDGRGLDGSGAVSHASGSRVVGNITRLSHNALAAEVKAIEANLYTQTIQVGGSPQTQRAKLNVAAGSNVTVTPSDNGSDTTTITIAAAGGGGAAAATGASIITPVWGGPVASYTFYVSTPSGYIATFPYDMTPTKAYIRVTVADTSSCTGGTCGMTLNVYNAAGTTKLGEFHTTSIGAAADVLFTVTGVTFTAGVPYLLTLSTDSATVSVSAAGGGSDAYPGWLATGIAYAGRCTNTTTGNGASIVGPTTCGVFNASDANSQYWIQWVK